MEIEFLLGPAGSGKTYRCLEETRLALRRTEGAPLIFLAPKQATFQLERQLLQSDLAGYTRLHILSFERLAEFVFEQRGSALPPLLTEEGRVMVLRALLEQRHSALRIFHGSARRPGFARQLSLLLRELRNHQVGADRLRQLAKQVGSLQRLDHKLEDLASLLEAYIAWLESKELLDADLLLDLAAGALRSDPKPAQARIERLWLDGFAEMTPQERSLLGALLPHCGKATLAFCLDPAPAATWYSPWSLVGETVRRCHEQFAGLAEAKIRTTVLERDPSRSRFTASVPLQHLERHWAHPKSFEADPAGSDEASVADSIRIVECGNPDAEATFVAREILRWARAGGRYRETAILVRQLDQYHEPVRRVFARYGIPLFVDRREMVAHHPLADITRNALKTVAFGWEHRDWFGVLKSGLVWSDQSEIDRLENMSLAQGWKGEAWRSPLRCEPGEAGWVERMRVKLAAPFITLEQALGQMPTGFQLAQALEELWENLGIARQLERWSQGSGAIDPPSSTLHATVWRQMQEWLDNIGLAFADQAMSLSRWLPILEAGLEGLTVGVIPPVLDQVLLGAIDRSRNPDLQQVFILGMNEGVFPAPPASRALLSPADREILEQAGCDLGPSQLEQLAHERYFAYIACTRARRRVVMTAAARDGGGAQLNPSSIFRHLRRLFPTLTPRIFSGSEPWISGEHPCELIGPLLLQQASHIRGHPIDPGLERLQHLPPFQEALERLRHAHAAEETPRLDPALAAPLYGEILHTSVSRLEKFAACPFRFFVDSGLKAEERVRFVLDVRQQGSFQHEVLAQFHNRVIERHGAWRNLASAEAGQMVRGIAGELIPNFENGILTASDQNLFQARAYAELLGQFIEVIVEWFSQYQFDPVSVELAFGGAKHPLPGWTLDLGNGRSLMFHGRVDRIDLWRAPNGREAACVVIDYKSSLRTVSDVLLREGIQLQLPVYLNLLKHLADPGPVFGVERLVPAGVFYINLRGAFNLASTRPMAQSDPMQARKQAYQHMGLFNATFLPQLDSRGQDQGDQFKYRLTKSGRPYKYSQGRLEPDFDLMLQTAQERVRDFGQRIYAGDIAVDPYRHGRDVACAICDFKAICRIDPWEHQYRVLRAAPRSGESQRK